ncbi:MAG: histidine--tRNA ligase [Holophagales bacterium]|jgi:histidyl-tRNA synthetase|nr:histidine--tRNA ligase [Holophagales bacterium]
MAQTVKGTRDIFGPELRWFQWIEEITRQTMARHGYEEIRTPVLEEIEVFKRSVGESSDIVNKEMYDFIDKGGRHVAMRPENTAGVVRAAIQHKFFETNDPKRLYYIGPMFRYERMQTGRYRQFWQIGAEIFGVATPEADAENLTLLFELLQELGLVKLTLSINSVGTPECRPAFYQALRDFFDKSESEFCADCHRRIQENPLRVLDCKIPTCQAALEGHPVITDFLDEVSLKHHARLKEILTALEIPFEDNPRLVRGLDYYTRTAFEVMSSDLGAQSALLGGGRYDGLVKQLGGPEVPGFGWAIGLDRLAILMQAIHGDAPGKKPILLIPVGESAAIKAMILAKEWRWAGLEIQLETRNVPLKKSLQTANRQDFQLAMILGDSEIEQGVITVKDLTQGTQETMKLDSVVSDLRQSAYR